MNFHFFCSTQLIERKTIVKRASRIPISTRHRSPSPPIVIYKKSQHRTLDDLRWYCLARKFSIIWQKATFGCHLRQIRTVSQKKCLRQHFLHWKQTINDDRLEQYALNFYHRRLLKNVFQHWFSITVEHRHDYQTADEHLKRKRLEMSWCYWKEQFIKRQRLKRKYLLANEKYRRNLASRVS